VQVGVDGSHRAEINCGGTELETLTRSCGRRRGRLCWRLWGSRRHASGDAAAVKHYAGSNEAEQSDTAHYGGNGEAARESSATARRVEVR